MAHARRDEKGPAVGIELSGNVVAHNVAEEEHGKQQRGQQIVAKTFPNEFHGCKGTLF